MVANEHGADARWEGGNNKRLAIPPGGPHLLVVRGSYEKKDITTETQKVQGEPPATSEVPLAEPLEPSRARMDSFGRKQNASRFLMLNEDPQLPSPSIFIRSFSPRHLALMGTGPFVAERLQFTSACGVRISKVQGPQ